MRYLFTQIYNRHLSPDKQFVHSVKLMLGVTPVRPALYKKAFLHISKSQKTSENNERLELLGDAILNSVVIHYIFTKFPYKDEGFLSELRSKIVSRESLNKFGRKMNLETLVQTSERYILDQSKNILGNTLEAIIGAMYLDRDYHFTANYIRKNILTQYVDWDKIEDYILNFKSKLIEFTQKENYTIDFKVLREEMKFRRKHFTCGVYINGVLKSKGEGYSKKEAEQNASEKLVKEWEIQ